MKPDPLFVDLYEGDGRKVWRLFVGAGSPWHGAVFKASQGVYYHSTWLITERRAFLQAAQRSGRYGVDLFDGMYHFLDFANDGRQQAEYCMQQVAASGGELLGTLPLMVDVERGGQSIASPSRAQVVDVTTAFAERYHEITGRIPTLYGGELLRSLRITGRLGCGRSVVALYEAELHGDGESTAEFLARTGTDLEHLLLWQYCGDGVRKLANYPNEAPGCGRIDISVLTLPGGLDAVRALMPSHCSASAPSG